MKKLLLLFLIIPIIFSFCSDGSDEPELPDYFQEETLTEPALSQGGGDMYTSMYIEPYPGYTATVVLCDTVPVIPGRYIKQVSNFPTMNYDYSTLHYLDCDKVGYVFVTAYEKRKVHRVLIQLPHNHPARPKRMGDTMKVTTTYQKK